MKSKRTEDSWLYNLSSILAFTLIILFSMHRGATAQQLLGDPIDISQDFSKLENTYFLSNRVLSFDPTTGIGTLEWKRYAQHPTYSFNKMDKGLSPIIQKYMFGSDLLVAPLIEEGNSRRVYLPPGSWIDYQTGKVYRGAEWHQISSGEIPVLLLVKDHSVVPHIGVAQSTSQMNWNAIELRVFSTDISAATGLFALPQENLLTLRLDASQNEFVMKDDPLRGKVKWQIRRFKTQ